MPLAFRNGMFRTGDLGYQDADGYFYILDRQWGELVMACVVLKPGMALSANDLTTHCRQFLANYKIPRARRVFRYRITEKRFRQDPQKGSSRAILGSRTAGCRRGDKNAYYRAETERRSSSTGAAVRDLPRCAARNSRYSFMPWPVLADTLKTFMPGRTA